MCYGGFKLMSHPKTITHINSILMLVTNNIHTCWQLFFDYIITVKWTIISVILGLMTKCICMVLFTLYLACRVKISNAHSLSSSLPPSLLPFSLYPLPTIIIEVDGFILKGTHCTQCLDRRLIYVWYKSNDNGEVHQECSYSNYVAQSWRRKVNCPKNWITARTITLQGC